MTEMKSIFVFPNGIPRLNRLEITRTDGYRWNQIDKHISERARPTLSESGLEI